MSISDEFWESEDFLPKYLDLGRKLTHNHNTKEKNFDFEFQTYNSNKSLPCYKYDLMTRACINNKGFMTKEFMTNKDCMDTAMWFTQCVNDFKVMTIYKKYFSDEMLREKNADPVYRLNDVL